MDTTLPLDGRPRLNARRFTTQHTAPVTSATVPKRRCSTARGEAHASFLDVTPLFHGHVLLVPTRHVETLGELEPEEVGPLFVEARRLARAVERALGAGGTFVAMNNRVSQSVPHLHVHVVPRTKGDGLKGFFWPRKKYASDEERETVRAAIAGALEPEA